MHVLYSQHTISPILNTLALSVKGLGHTVYHIHMYKVMKMVPPAITVLLFISLLLYCKFHFPVGLLNFNTRHHNIAER